MLFYQGESNTDTRFEANMSAFVAGPTSYSCRIRAFLADVSATSRTPPPIFFCTQLSLCPTHWQCRNPQLRRAFGYVLPFIYVELAACDTYPLASIADEDWPLLRQSQRGVLDHPVRVVTFSCAYACFSAASFYHVRTKKATNRESITLFTL